MMRRSGVLVLGLAAALAMTLGAATHARAGTPDDGSVDDPAVQAPAYSIQGPASGFGYAPAPPPTQSTSSQPAAVIPVMQPAPTPVDSTAVRAPSPTGIPFATAQCNDGWFSYSQTRVGTCAGHRGVLVWVTQPGTASAVLWERQLQAAGSLGNGWVGSAPISPAQASSPAPSPSTQTPPPGCVSYTGGLCVTQCVDGQWSSATRGGTCSSHGGEAD
jgi:Protein of unknown function (DUF3761)